MKVQVSLVAVLLFVLLIFVVRNDTCGGTRLSSDERDHLEESLRNINEAPPRATTSASR